jgi:hypothetical protein
MPRPTRRSPRSSTAGRLLGLAATVVAAAIGVASLSGCAGDEPLQPTLPTVNFAPKLIIEIHEHRLAFVKGPRADDAVSTGDPTVPTGTVIEIVNTGPGDHRLQGDTVFDTGILRAGERTTVVLTNDTTSAKRITITDPGDAAVQGTITVNPKSS